MRRRTVARTLAIIAGILVGLTAYGCEAVQEVVEDSIDEILDIVGEEIQ